MSYPNRGLSIDIGTDKIKIIQYKRNRDKVKIIQSLLIDTPDNCLDDGMIKQMDTLSEVIRDGIKDKNIKEKKVMFTVASSKIITREVDLPDLPKKKLDNLIQMNAEEYFPVDLSEYTTDYRILDHYEDGEDKMIRVNMVAAFTELMETYINLAGVLGLKLVGIDFAGNSIVNYAQRTKIEDTYLLLDLGSNSTMVTIMNGKDVRFNRNLVYGTSVVIGSIQNHFNVRYKEAVKISAEQALLKQEQAAEDYLSNEVTGALDQILSGVARLVDFYTSRNKGGIDKIYLVGGGTKINGIVEYITSYFNVSAEVVDTHEYVQVTEGVEFNENSVFFANTIGAVYSEMNLLPADFLNRDKQKAAMRLRLELAILALLLIGGAMYIPYMNVQTLKAEKQALQNEIDEKKVVEAVKAEYDKAVQTASFYQSVDKLSASTTEIVVEVLETMEEEIPTEIDYMNINNTEEGMIITCIASDKLTIINLITVLKNISINDSPVFSDVYVPSYAKLEELLDDSEYSFAINCTYAKEVE